MANIIHLRRSWRAELRRAAKPRAERLKENARGIVQSALAASLAWAFATHVLGHPHPFFAPLSALIAIGLSQSHRTARTAELILGVAVGILVADLVIGVIGPGDWQIFLVVLLALGLAVLLGSGRTFASQAAVSAMLVATIQLPGSGLAGLRFVDALVGGVIALLVTFVFPAHPVKAVDRAAQHMLDELAGVLCDLAGALRQRDESLATRALHRVRELDADERRWREAVEVGYETARTSPAHMRARVELDEYALAAEQTDLLQRNVRVLARGVIRAIEVGDEVPEAVPKALEELARGVLGLGDELTLHGHDSAARDHALTAVARSSEAIRENSSLSTSALVAQIRFAATDLLCGLGTELPEAKTAVRAAA